MKTNELKKSQSYSIGFQIWKSAIFAFIALSAFACKKDGTVNPAADLTGTWKLINLKVSAKVTLQEPSSAGQLSQIGYYNYTTVKNGGTITFQGAAFTGVDLTYASADTATARLDSYLNGKLMGREDSIYTVRQPRYSVRGNYKTTTDSIYATSGAAGIFSILDSVPLNSMKYSVSGNTLTLSKVINEVNSYVIGLGEIKSVFQATALTTFQKQ